MKEKYSDKDYNNLKGLLSPSKLDILLNLYSSPKTSRQLYEEISKSKSTIIHNLEDLSKEKIIKRQDKKYAITSKGIILTKKIMNMINNMAFLNRYSDFLDNHDDITLPEDMINHMYLWNDSTLLVSDEINYSAVMNEFNSLLSNSKKIIMITPTYSDEHLKIILDALEEKRGCYTLITNKAFTDSLKKSPCMSQFSQLEKKGQVKLIECELNSSLNCIITCSDCFASIILFNNGVDDDSKMLVQKDKEKIEKLNRIIEYNMLNF